MAHHDLYASLGVSPGASCEELSREIERRLQAGATPSPAAPPEAQTKRPRKPGVILAVVVAVVALMAAAVLALLLLRDDAGTGEAASMSFVESAGLWYFVGFQD